MRFARVLLDALVEVLVVPIREGHPRLRDWPRGIGPIMALASVAYLICLALVIFAPLVVRHDSLVVIDGPELIGRATITLVSWLTTLTMALGLTAVLHIQPLLRVIALMLLLTPLLPLLASQGQGWLAGAAILALIVFFVFRARGRFAAWEFPVIWLLVCIGLLGPLRIEVNLGYDQRTMSMQLVLMSMQALAVPALMMAGYAASQITVSLSQWVGFRFTETLSRPLSLGLASVLAAAHLGDALWRTLNAQAGWSAGSWLGSVLVLLIAVGVVLVLRAGLPLRGRRRTEPAHPDELADSWRRPAYLMALVMLGPILLGNLAAVGGAIVGLLSGSTPDWLATLTTSSLFVVLARFGQAIFAAVLGWRRARVGDAVAPVVLGAYSAVMALSATAILTGARWLTWEAELVGALLVIAAVVLALRSGGQAGLVHLLVVGLLVWLYRFRELISEPSAVFVTASASALLLLSLGWRVLTDGTLARGDSSQFPAPARVLTYATMSLLAVLTLAVSAQLRVQGSALDQTAMIAFGDRTLGGALYLAAGLASLLGLAQAGGRRRSDVALASPAGPRFG